MSAARRGPRRPALEIRPPTRRELPAVGALAARLIAQHREWDPLRFFALPDPARSYERYFGSVLGRKDTVILAAFDWERVLGYAYASLLPRDWDLLRDHCGGLHDLYVDEAARRQGVGERLVEAVLAALAKRGAPRVVLYSAWANQSAQRFFARVGFRSTMVEMTREL